MNVIGHQAKRINLTFELVLPLRKVVEIKKVVVITGKDGLAIMTTLDDVVRIVGKDDSCGSGHIAYLSR